MLKITKYKPIKELTKGSKNTSGRNNKGQILIKSRGGGNKKLYRKIEDNISKSMILSLSYDPYRTSHIALIKNFETNKYNYIIAPDKIKPLQLIENKPVIENNSVGNRFELKYSKPGQFLSNVELYPNKGGTFAKSAGTFIQVLKQEKLKTSYIKVKLPSGEQRLLNKECKATLGVVSNISWNERIIKKAGRSRWLNKRPHVRGVAMNPVDHPHGGGEGRTSGGRPSVTPQGWPAKGRPTKKKKNNLILVLAKEAKKKNEKK